MNCTVRELILLVSNKEFFLASPISIAFNGNFAQFTLLRKKERKKRRGDLVWFRLDHAQFTVHIIAGPSKYFTDQVFTLMSSRQQGKSKNNFRPPALWLWWPRSFISSACRHLFFFLANVAVLLFIFCSWWQDPGCCHLQVSNKDEAETASNLSQLNQFSWTRTRTRTRTHLLALLRLPEYHWVIEFIISLLG